VLGLIADVTLKVTALPRLRRSLLVAVHDLGRGVAWAQTCLSVAMASTGIVLGKMTSRLPALVASDAPYVLALSAEGPAEDVRSELALARARLVEAGAPVPLEVEGAAACDLWKQFLAGAWGARLLLRVGMPPKDLGRYLLDQSNVLQSGDFLADVAGGQLYVAAASTDSGEAQSYIARLRDPAVMGGGYAIILDAPNVLAEQLDRWGRQPQTLELMKRLKSRWDPAGILNPGAFLV
jgi:FAD/FMN-containing dehydrogenase